ncbi:AgmX/PglI C-terminal domain-containing protein [Shewanella gelidii]|uniref:AgmX/PglI C-terminal domain-containing protein n=1 Tax=Shewanella gelidii TaxID=1642821 RepID=A0A917JLU5_9GAMM|nr:AgmX/PglI C-terminal domain-containing protein [Shewanella gelidii]MCL1099198.1 AgmX/PglI C-terminal domain-containing protein [Shewanella gelidii]GGI76359.1 hypothetical protein GCM10009332_12160 [Shewanella gelidii]
MSTVTLPNTRQHHGFSHMGELFRPSKQDKLFKRILMLLLLIYLGFAILIPLLEQAVIPREIKEQVPPQLAKVMLQEKRLPPPEKPKEEPVPEPELKKEPEIVEEVKQEQPITPPKMTRETAREVAKTSGLAAMKDELFSMREAFDIKPAAQSQLKQTQAKEVKVKRKLIAAAANKQSDGISQANVTQTVTSDALSTNNTQQVRLAKEEVIASQGAIAEKRSLASSAGQRSEAAIRRTLEANKARLYALYNRALRKDPFLKGKVLFEIEIQPNGTTSRVKIKSSELNHKKLERQLTLVLRSIRFPKEKVATMTTIWAIDFLPS